MQSSRRSDQMKKIHSHVMSATTPPSLPQTPTAGPNMCTGNRTAAYTLVSSETCGARFRAQRGTVRRRRRRVFRRSGRGEKRAPAHLPPSPLLVRKHAVREHLPPQSSLQQRYPARRRRCGRRDGSENVGPVSNRSAAGVDGHRETEPAARRSPPRKCLMSW